MPVPPPTVKRLGRLFTESVAVRPRQEITFSADSFQEYVDDFLRPMEAHYGAALPRITRKAENARGHISILVKEQAVPIRDTYRFYLRELSRGELLDFYFPRLMRYGSDALRSYSAQVSFSGAVMIPVLDSRTDTWMSLTPFEILSQMPGVKRASGNVLIGGLGMGWFTRRVLQSRKVDRVTVVEKDEGIVSYFGEPLLKEFGSRIRIVHGDAFDAVRPSAYDSVLFDIWAGVGQSLSDERWTALAKKHANAWAW